jgi:hypothetical protein
LYLQNSQNIQKSGYAPNSKLTTESGEERGGCGKHAGASQPRLYQPTLPQH